MNLYRAVALSFLLLGLTRPALAQHIWMDVDGDGQCTGADVLSPSVTEVPIYIDTDTNQDGTPASCASGAEALTLNWFSLYVTAPGGGVEYTGWRFYGPDFTVSDLGVQGNDSWLALTAKVPLAAGTHQICSVRLTVTGNPTLAFKSMVFGSQCPGVSSDNVIKYGIDFTGACGTATLTGTTETTWGKIKNLYRN